jgi:hypothetical protein
MVPDVHQPERGDSRRALDATTQSLRRHNMQPAKLAYKLFRDSVQSSPKIASVDIR